MESMYFSVRSLLHLYITKPWPNEGLLIPKCMLLMMVNDVNKCQPLIYQFCIKERKYVLFYLSMHVSQFPFLFLVVLSVVLSVRNKMVDGTTKFNRLSFHVFRNTFFLQNVIPAAWIMVLDSIYSNISRLISRWIV